MSGSDDIVLAARILRRGGIVAFPTETVYGLGADARDCDAVARVFDAKGRPPTNPVIVHVADATLAEQFSRGWNATSEALAAEFWPGPLTIVLPKSDAIVSAVSAGLGSVGVRCPDHPLALELLREFDGPLIGPSANRSTHVSPTTAEHVRDELGDKIDMILDGGACRVGIESTVLDLTSPTPTILRPGVISADQIEAVIGRVDVFRGNVNASTNAPSPGLHTVHYAPLTTTYRVEHDNLETLRTWLDGHPERRITILARTSDATSVESRSPSQNHHVEKLPDDPPGYARALYASLRQADANGGSSIWVVMPPDSPDWRAVRDRLTRASRMPFDR